MEFGDVLMVVYSCWWMVLLWKKLRGKGRDGVVFSFNRSIEFDGFLRGWWLMEIGGERKKRKNL